MAKETGTVARLISRPLVHLLRFVCGVSLLFAMLVLVCAAFIALRISDAPFEMPKLTDFIERKINTASPDTVISVGNVSISGDGPEVFTSPTVTLDDVTLKDQLGQEMVSAATVELGLSGASAVQGQLKPQTLSVSGIDVKISRDLQGYFNIQFGKNGDVPSVKTIKDFFEQFDAVDQLSKVEKVSLRGSQIVFDDQLQSTTHVFQNTQVDIVRDADRFELTARLSISIAGGEKASVRAKLIHTLGQTSDQFEVAFDNLSTADIARRIKALDWLRTVDASVFGNLTTRLENSQTIGDFSGTLTLRNGFVRDTGLPDAVPFDQIKAYFSYDKDLSQFTFADLQITAPTLSGHAEGIATLSRNRTGLVDSVTAQLGFEDIKLAHAPAFAGLIGFAKGQFQGVYTVADSRLNVDKITITDGPATYAIKGASWAKPSAWNHAYTATADTVGIDRLMGLWPLGLIPKTRRWIKANITKGTIEAVKATYELTDGTPDFTLDFDAKNVTTTFLRSMPPLRAGNGTGRIANKRLNIVLDSGYVQAGTAGQLDLTGSVFSIPDITKRPALADIKLKTKGSLAASLFALNVEKFQFITKAGLPIKLGTGQATTSGRLKFPLSKKTKIQDVDLNFEATIKDFKSTRLVPNRRLAAQNLTAKVNTKRVSISGPILVDGIQTTSNWSMVFRDKGRSKVKTSLPLSTQSMAAFGVKLPKGVIKGSAKGALDLTLVRGQSPRYSLTSNLLGMSMSVPSLGWSKPAKSKGTFAVSGRLGKVASVDKISLKTPGLTTAGTLSLTPAGGLKSANLTGLKIGKWLDTTATVTPSAGRLRVALRGGVADLRHYKVSGKVSGSGAGRTRTSIRARALKLQVTNTIALHAVSTDLTSAAGGLAGQFQGKVNGGTAISGKLSPAKTGTRIDVTAKDAGGVLRSSKLFSSYRGGALSFNMTPSGTSGTYASSFKITGGRLKQNNAIAELLNAMSVVGLLQQLSGSGIYFDTIKGGLEIRPKGVVLKKVSAVGPSMGLTANGWYDSKRKSLDLEGVVTPIYLLNGVFERAFGKLFGKQKGEGLFSFVYTLKGAVGKPSVSVNPFSVLTPGIFRRIFDQNVPIPPK